MAETAAEFLKKIKIPDVQKRSPIDALAFMVVNNFTVKQYTVQYVLFNYSLLLMILFYLRLLKIDFNGIIFMSKLVSTPHKIFSHIFLHQKPTVIYLQMKQCSDRKQVTKMKLFVTYFLFKIVVVILELPNKSAKPI